MSDKEFLELAVTFKGESTEPVPCACIIVLNGEIIAKTYNSQRADGIATHHAEIKAITEANKRTGQRKLLGAVAYCSCEPCVMCLSALSIAQVEKIVYSELMKDVAPDDPMSRIDAKVFATEYLKNPPHLERLVV